MQLVLIMCNGLIVYNDFTHIFQRIKTRIKEYKNLENQRYLVTIFKVYYIKNKKLNRILDCVMLLP